MEETLQSLLSETDPVGRLHHFSELLQSLTPENAETVARALEDAPAFVTEDNLWELFFMTWGKIDGPSAIAFADKSGSDEEGVLSDLSRTISKMAALAGWTGEAPEEAKTWLSSLENQEERDELADGIVYGLAMRNIDAATSYALSFSDEESDKAEEYLGMIADLQVAHGLSTALNWVETLPDGPSKRKALTEVAREYADQDPTKAAEWISPYLEEDFVEGAISQISREWIKSDPANALSWIASLPEGDSRSQVLSDAIWQWSRRSPRQAGDYLAHLPPGHERDSAMRAYSRSVVDEEPSSAMEWAQAIEQEDLRNETITQIAREWYRLDIAAANRWLQSTNLPESVIQGILKPSGDYPAE